MRLLVLAAAISALPSAAFAVELPPVHYPDLPAQATSAEGFVPAGWTLEYRAEGDLDQDGRADLALVLRQQDRRNVVEHDGFGPSPFDSNPRILAIAWSRPSGYVLATQNHVLIPRPDDAAASDVLDEDGGVFIQHGTLMVALYSWTSAGSWYSGATSYTFRWQDGDFALIGYDRDSVMRNSGQTEQMSINFSTRKVKFVEGSTFEDKEQVRWQPLRDGRRWTLDSVGDGWAFDPLRGAG
ncbi:MAG: hypothetical protein RR704_07205 [Stenotrophomonas sp.]